jgi:hypothetical protein
LARAIETGLAKTAFSDAMAPENSIDGREGGAKVILDIYQASLKYTVRAPLGASAMTGPGRPTLHKPEHAGRARELCARGATNPDLAGRFGVARSTIGQWIASHPEFAEAVQQGRDVADVSAVEPLFTRVTRLTRNLIGMTNDQPSVRGFAVSPTGCSPPQSKAKRAAERAERAETSNP